MVKCSQCGRELARTREGGLVAVISGAVMGDEYTDSYFFCPDCGVYTVEAYHDRFHGEDSVSVQGPIPKERGDERVELIRRCPDPVNKNCNCEAHREYF